jgi:hypothetical protein
MPMNVELTHEERRHIASHLKLPTYAEEADAKTAHGILVKIGFNAEVLHLKPDPPWVQTPGWIVSVTGGEG